MLDLDEVINAYKNTRLASIKELRDKVNLIRELSRHLKRLEEAKAELSRLTDFHKSAVLSLESAARVEITEPVFEVSAYSPVVQVVIQDPNRYGSWVYDTRGNSSVKPAEKSKIDIIMENCRCAYIKHPPCSWCESCIEED